MIAIGAHRAMGGCGGVRQPEALGIIRLVRLLLCIIFYLFILETNKHGAAGWCESRTERMKDFLGTGFARAEKLVLDAGQTES